MSLFHFGRMSTRLNMKQIWFELQIAHLFKCWLYIVINVIAVKWHFINKSPTDVFCNVNSLSYNIPLQVNLIKQLLPHTILHS